MKNYFRYSFIMTLTAILLLSAISLISPKQVFGIKLKQANIYSDLISGSDLRKNFGLSGESAIDIMARKHDTLIMELNRLTDSMYVFERRQRLMEQTRERERAQRIAARSAVDLGALGVTDYSHGGYLLDTFHEKLTKSRTSNTRIAFIGDSFIEGDLLTSDLRYFLQKEYGGGGVGFVPIYSKVAKMRGSVKHDMSRGWKEHTLLRNAESDKYMLSGSYYTPSADGEWVEYSTTQLCATTPTVKRVRLLFINEGSTTIRAIINKGESEETFTPESSSELQQITVTGDISTIRFEFTSVENFIGYGVILDNKTGVTLDNYSLRGNSGIGMTAVNSQLCRQMSDIGMDYDLIIMEYGLNIVEDEVTHYGSYKTRMISVIEHLQECYPDTPIIVMGVSDRCTQIEGDFLTMQGVIAMDATQRDMAKLTETAFWSTLSAMKSMGGMPQFVNRGWAAKDYTHIGYMGGREIAKKFYEALKVR